MKTSIENDKIKVDFEALKSTDYIAQLTVKEIRDLMSDMHNDSVESLIDMIDEAQGAVAGKILDESYVIIKIVK